MQNKNKRSLASRIKHDAKVVAEGVKDVFSRDKERLKVGAEISKAAKKDPEFGKLIRDIQRGKYEMSLTNKEIKRIYGTGNANKSRGTASSAVRKLVK